MGRAPLRADGTVRPRLKSGEDGLHGDVRVGEDRDRRGSGDTMSRRPMLAL